MRQLKPLAINFAVSGIAVIAILFAVESALRLFPTLLPHGSYGSSLYDPELQTNVHGSTAIYNKVRFVVREPNAEGFLDVEHTRAKPAGVVRIGFFGDSYVEALQVRLDQTFYRILPARIGGRPIEPFGMGISGWGTLHSYLAHRVKAPRYDLDVVVYVFVENDLGDNAYSIQSARAGRLTSKAFAELADEPPGYRIRWTNPPDEVGAAYRVGKLVQNRLLIGRVLWSRIALLRSRGVAVQANAADQAMVRRTQPESVPNQNDLAGSWPREYVEEAQELGSRILRSWRDDAQRSGRDFLVLYVPRGEAQLLGSFAVGETWLPWLRRTCSELAIPLVDPSDDLRAGLERGERMYDDHWTPAGHRVIARVLDRALGPVIARRSGRTDSG